eukprot:TRINITY_DN8890_c0_g1_i1.p1 TRINITY_DN8890_c0_g1~~TRINITY_DN8890_c0_g1_i1.p1  ORF type:complete len:243 (-),score=89.24 TRINITY_DN8890_c0_g1_i1:14-742(-)
MVASERKFNLSFLIYLSFLFLIFVEVLVCDNLDDGRELKGNGYEEEIEEDEMIAVDEENETDVGGEVEKGDENEAYSQEEEEVEGEKDEEDVEGEGDVEGDVEELETETTSIIPSEQQEEGNFHSPILREEGGGESQSGASETGTSEFGGAGGGEGGGGGGDGESQSAAEILFSAIRGTATAMGSLPLGEVEVSGDPAWGMWDQTSYKFARLFGQFRMPDGTHQELPYPPFLHKLYLKRKKR